MKNIFKIIITIFLISFILVNAKLAHSSYWQAFLLHDYNSNTYIIPYNKVDQNVDNFPNLTLSALPMKAIKARYLIKLDSLDLAKNMLKKAIKTHPDHMSLIDMLASIYLKEGDIDSAYTLSKLAFNKMPNVNNHRSTYFQVLRRLKKVEELDIAFEMVKNKSESKSHWYDYIFSKVTLENNKEEQKGLIDEFKQKFPSENQEGITTLINMINVGSRSYSIFSYFSNIGDNYFREENYIKASEFYELALSYNQENYLLYENLAIAYDLSEMYSKALNYYDIVIDQFKPIDGRVEFYKGLMLIKTGDAKSGCKYIKQSSDKNFILNTTKISASNVLVSLCSNN